MPALSISVPFPIFNDRDGQPLDNGYVYIGTPYLDPQINPVQVYFDEALTIPAYQPLRTINGYVSNAGTPAQLYVNGVNFSIKVLDKDANLVYSFANGTGINPNASGVQYDPAGVGAVVTNVQEILRRPGIDVRDYGAVGNGVTNDLTAIKNARDQAGVLGVPLLFSPGTYGVNDTFSLTKGACTVVVFQPGAKIKLLSNTTIGGVCSVWDGQPATEQVHIFNATVDCQNWPGENAMSGVHPVGANFYNLTVRNCSHDSIQPWYGGKGLQWEGTTGTPNCKVFNFVAENCSVGIDLGSPGALTNFTHIGVFNSSMYDVDIPIYINDTTATTVPDSYDSLEINIDGVHCRNCGALTYPTASSLGGGIIVMDRGYKATVRNVQVINDRGGYGTTGYGGIGALVRGQGKGLVLENVLFSGSYLAAIFDFNPSTFQSPFGGDVASYVLANNIRVYANMDYVVNCLPGGNKLGVGVMRQVEIGTTEATLGGIVSANAGAYNNTFLELIDRNNNFSTTGLLNLKDIYIRGNSFTGANGIAGQGYLSQFANEWTPVDGSTDNLTFTAASGWWFRIGNLAMIWAQVTYPVTATGGNARIGGLPFYPRDFNAVIGGGGISKTTTSAVGAVIPEKSSDKATVVSPSGANVPNSSLSGHTISFMLTFPIRIDY